MSGFPTLTEVAAMHSICSCGEWANDIEEQGRHLADAWREACTISTVEELDALPVGAVALDDMSGILQRDGDAWLMAGYEGLHLPILPALLIWHPDWARP